MFIMQMLQEFVRMLNSLTESHRSICTPLELGSILSAIRLIPSEELLKFRNSADKDGRVPSMRDNTAISNMIIQLKIETLPNRGHYEVTMNYDLYKSKFFVKVRIKFHLSCTTCKSFGFLLIFPFIITRKRT